MTVIIMNAILLWPWTDAAKKGASLHMPDAYPLINNLFIIVYIVEFVLKVCYNDGKASRPYYGLILGLIVVGLGLGLRLGFTVLWPH